MHAAVLQSLSHLKREGPLCFVFRDLRALSPLFRGIKHNSQAWSLSFIVTRSPFQVAGFGVVVGAIASGAEASSVAFSCAYLSVYFDGNFRFKLLLLFECAAAAELGATVERASEGLKEEFSVDFAHVGMAAASSISHSFISGNPPVIEAI